MLAIRETVGSIVVIRYLAMPYFRMANATLSSALSAFTMEVDMGSGGTHSLYSPGKNSLIIRVI